MLDNNIIHNNPDLVQVFEKIALHNSLKERLVKKDIEKVKKI